MEALGRTRTQGDAGVRKRTPNACVRCRKQKIKCSGTVPCVQCDKRSVTCEFEDQQQKVLVSQSYIDHLERRAARRRRASDELHNETEVEPRASESARDTTRSATPSRSDNEDDSDSEIGHNRDEARIALDPETTNPLNTTTSDEAWTRTSANRPHYLGKTSNWSFGRRVLNIIHERLTGSKMPSTDLHFEASTYDLGWDGRRKSNVTENPSIPTSDFALFLINAVKFHCGRLFHLFDEMTFMANFTEFYARPSEERDYSSLWYIHLLLVLAFGKAFVVRASNARSPSGSDLFVQAMQLLPNHIFLGIDPVQSIEILCCAALYLQCLDLRSAAYNMIGQALRMAVEQGMHTEMSTLHLSEAELERCRESWWTVYILDRQMTSLMGVPLGLSDDDVSALLPTLGGSSKKRMALNLHVELAKAQAVILRTVYGRKANNKARYLASMKEALKILARTTNERNTSFPLDLSKAAGGIDRMAAYLHLFHHQALIVATRPLLYTFLQKRLASSSAMRVSSSRGARSLLRVCISAARRCLVIVEALLAQGLLESFIPFDLEATFSSATVLAVASAVDASLVRDKEKYMDISYNVLQEMRWHGNLVAGFQKRELEQLFSDLSELDKVNLSNDWASPQVPRGQLDSYASSHLTVGGEHMSGDLDNIFTTLSEWNSEDGVSGEQLLELADGLDLDGINWPGIMDPEPYMPSS